MLLAVPLLLFPLSPIQTQETNKSPRLATGISFVLPQEPKPDYDKDVLEPLRIAQAETKRECDAAGGALDGLTCVLPPPPKPVVAPAVYVAPAASPQASGDILGYAQSIAVARGWSWADWQDLGYKESGWQVGRLNEGSYACGIGQALSCTKMYPHATNGWIQANMYQNAQGKWFIPGDYKVEVEWMANYIAGRYGNPSNALVFWNCIGLCGGVQKYATWY